MSLIERFSPAIEHELDPQASRKRLFSDESNLDSVSPTPSLVSEKKGGYTSLCENLVWSVIPSEARNLALSIFNTLRDSSSPVALLKIALPRTGCQRFMRLRELGLWLEGRLGTPVYAAF